jgi:hypothetical protein
LDEEQNRALYAGEALEISTKHRSVFVACLSDHPHLKGDIDPKAPSFAVSAEAAAVIRWHILTYLNVLESILTAERHGIADSDIIREQFHYLVNPMEGHTGLKHFRTAAGGHAAYPAIADLVARLVKSSESTVAGKKPLWQARSPRD